METKYAVGMKNKEGYPDPTAFEAIRALVTKRFDYRPIIYVCSPFSEDPEGNTKKAVRYSRFVVDEGGIPITPHLYLPLFMEEETERDLAMFMDLVLLTKCAELWVFGDEITDGMLIEINQAQQKGKTIRFVGEEEVNGEA